MIRAYSNFDILDVCWGAEPQGSEPLTLLDQSAGESVLQLAVDEVPPPGKRRITEAQRAEVVRLYESGMDLTAISRATGRYWISVEWLLHEAGVRKAKVRPGGAWPRNGYRSPP